MNTTEAANEEVDSNVVYMGDFLIRRYNKMRAEYDRLSEQADGLSKMDKDKFAAPLRGKASALEPKLEKMENQISFIIRGGHGSRIPNRGYSLQYGQPMPIPPPVKITITQPQ